MILNKPDSFFPLLPLCYLPPISWFTLFLKHEEAHIEIHEHFIKQSYRNRCYIASPNGPLHLVIPLSGSTDKTPFKDVRIAYDNSWQKQHWKSLEAAYRSSPYFEYYEDDLVSFYREEYEFLSDFNTGLLKKVLSLLKIKKELLFTTEYNKEYPGFIDYRVSLSPKEKHNASSSIGSTPYPQVFETKTGFIPNLSIVDLLFNQGPQAMDYLSPTMV